MQVEAMGSATADGESATLWQSRAPVMERYGQGWICRAAAGGEIVSNFEGVAFCVELDRFVHTYKSGLDRGFWELGSRTYEGALQEAEALKRQMQLPL